MGNNLKSGSKREMPSEQAHVNQKGVINQTNDSKNTERVTKNLRKYKSAKVAFIEGNRLFRESQFELAKVEYSNA